MDASAQFGILVKFEEDEVHSLELNLIIPVQVTLTDALEITAISSVLPILEVLYLKENFKRYVIYIS